MRDLVSRNRPNLNSADSPLARARKRSGVAVRANSMPESEPVRAAGAETNAAKGLTPLTPVEERILAGIMAEPMDYIDHPDFHLASAPERIYGIAEIERPDVTWYRPLMDDFIAARSRTIRSPKSFAATSPLHATASLPSLRTSAIVSCAGASSMSLTTIFAPSRASLSAML
jgi:hypothetical protein